MPKTRIIKDAQASLRRSRPRFAVGLAWPIEIGDSARELAAVIDRYVDGLDGDVRADALAIICAHLDAMLHAIAS